MSKPHATGLVIGMAAPLDLPLSRLSHFPALQVCALLDSDLGFAGKTRTHKDKAFHTHTHTHTYVARQRKLVSEGNPWVILLPFALFVQFM